MYRAKLRVMRITEIHGGRHEIELYAVTAKSPYDRPGLDDDRSEENVSFWDATPTAEIKVHVEKGHALPDWAVVERPVYMDFTVGEEGNCYASLTLNYHEQTVNLRLESYDHVRILADLGIHRTKTAVKLFDEIAPVWRSGKETRAQVRIHNEGLI